MTLMRGFEEVVSGWPNVSVHPHRFGGREFRFGSAEIGHVHAGGIVDIPFPRPVRDALLAEGLAEEHRWVPNSGWATFHVRNERDLNHAVRLMRLSYVRYAQRTTSDSQEMLERESGVLNLGTCISSLLRKHLPVKTESVAADSSAA